MRSKDQLRLPTPVDAIAIVHKVQGYEVRVTYSAQPQWKRKLISAKRSVVGYWIAGNRRVRGRTAPASISRVQENAVNYHAKRSDRQQSLEAGFEHHVVKPVDPQTLQEFMAAPAKQLSTR